MERDAGKAYMDTVNYISTHALTWSATYAFKRLLKLACDISTHALTWSATTTV